MITPVRRPWTARSPGFGTAPIRKVVRAPERAGAVRGGDRLHGVKLMADKATTIAKLITRSVDA
jgi:hypothetical protein